MSHIVEAVTQIANPDRELLVQALELVTRQYEQAEVERGVAEANRQTLIITYYYDWTWRRIECGLGRHSHSRSGEGDGHRRRFTFSNTSSAQHDRN
jgi:hypothetical protein